MVAVTSKNNKTMRREWCATLKREGFLIGVHSERSLWRLLNIVACIGDDANYSYQEYLVDSRGRTWSYREALVHDRELGNFGDGQAVPTEVQAEFNHFFDVR